jgi:hypothetical protein
MVRCIVGALIFSFASTAYADPILLLLLRFARDRAVSASIEAGVTNMQRQYSTVPSPTYGFALPTPAIERGNEEQQLRALLDENFLHLTADQRDQVFAGMQKIMQDPQNMQNKSQLLAEFAMKAREVKDVYRSLDRLTYSEKRSLAMQAKEEYRRLPDIERQQLVDVLQSGTLPVPRDLRDTMIAEFNTIGLAGAGNERRRE